MKIKGIYIKEIKSLIKQCGIFLSGMGNCAGKQVFGRLNVNPYARFYRFDNYPLGHLYYLVLKSSNTVKAQPGKSGKDRRLQRIFL
jgi:hypothetical protein